MKRRKGDRWRVYEEDRRRLEEEDGRAVVVGCRDGRRRCFLPLVRVRGSDHSHPADHDRDGNLFPFPAHTVWSCLLTDHVRVQCMLSAERELESTFPCWSHSPILTGFYSHCVQTTLREKHREETLRTNQIKNPERTPSLALQHPIPSPPTNPWPKPQKTEPPTRTLSRQNLCSPTVLFSVL